MATEPGAIPATHTHAPAEDPQPLSFWGALRYSSGSIGCGVFYGFNNFILSLFLLALGAPVTLNALLGSTRSFEGAVIQPLVGAWSDRTWRPPLGRRRPFILWCAPICAIVLALTPFVTHVSGLALPFGWSSHSPLVLATVCVFLFTVTFNIMYDPYQALLADITPERQRGKVNGIFQALGAVGQVVVLVAAFASAKLNHGTLPATLLFLITAGTLIVFFIPTMLGVHEPPALPGSDKVRRYRWGDYWEGLRQDPQVFLYFATQFFLWFGINAITPNLTYYAKQSLHFSDSITLALPFVLLISTAVFVAPMGLLAGRIGLKGVYLLGMGLLAGSCIAGAVIHAPGPLFIVLGIAGVGNAAQTAASFPLLTEIAFPDRMGVYTGLNSTVTSLAAPAGALLSATLIAQFGYGVFFPFVGAMFVLSLIPLTALRTDRSLAQRALHGPPAGTSVVN